MNADTVELKGTTYVPMDVVETIAFDAYEAGYLEREVDVREEDDIVQTRMERMRDHWWDHYEDI